MNTGEQQVRDNAMLVLEGYGDHGVNDKGHIFNLGHGIQPFAQPDNMSALVDTVQSQSAKFHR